MKFGIDNLKGHLKEKGGRESKKNMIGENSIAFALKYLVS